MNCIDYGVIQDAVAYYTRLVVRASPFVDKSPTCPPNGLHLPPTTRQKILRNHMKKPFIKLANICGGLILVFTNSFAHSQGTTTIRGFSSCGEWVQETQRNGNGKPDASSSFWLLGYLSGLATYSGKDALKGTTTESLYVWVSNYCQKNPLDNLADAGGELFRELARRKGLFP